MERLQKAIARAGICSRRKAEELIQAGRVVVNGCVITELGTRVEMEKDSVKVDGKRLRISSGRIYLLLNKPGGYVCTLSDPEGRPKVTDLIRGNSRRIFPVGRLDFHSEGLLLLTDDGDFANRVASAGDRFPKTYHVKVRGIPSTEDLREIAQGIMLEGKRTAPCRINPLKEGDNPWFQVILTEGRNNQIRKMFERLGHEVLKLKRVQIGFLRDSSLKLGEYRALTPQEIQRFLSERQTRR
jgi:23S rRNA pseudouridine2605 synthase